MLLGQWYSLLDRWYSWSIAETLPDHVRHIFIENYNSICSLTYPSIYHEAPKLEELLVSCLFFASSIKFFQCHKTCISPPFATCKRNTRGSVANHVDMNLTNTKMQYMPRRCHFKSFSYVYKSMCRHSKISLIDCDKQKELMN